MTEFNEQSFTLESFFALYNTYISADGSPHLDISIPVPGWSCIRYADKMFRMHIPPDFDSHLPIPHHHWDYFGRRFRDTPNGPWSSIVKSVRFSIYDFVEDHQVPVDKRLLDFLSPLDYVPLDEKLPEIEPLKLVTVGTRDSDTVPCLPDPLSYVSCEVVPPIQYTPLEAVQLARDVDLGGFVPTRNGGHLINKIMTGPLEIVESAKIEEEWTVCNSCGDKQTIFRPVQGELCLGIKIPSEVEVPAGAVILVRSNPPRGQYFLVCYVTQGVTTLRPGSGGGMVEVYYRGRIRNIGCNEAPPIVPPGILDTSRLCARHIALACGLQKRNGDSLQKMELCQMLAERLPFYLTLGSYVEDPLMTREHGVPDLTNGPPPDEICLHMMRGMVRGLHGATCSALMRSKDNTIPVVQDPSIIMALSTECQLLSEDSEDVDPNEHVYRGMRVNTGLYSCFHTSRADIIGNMAVHTARSKRWGGELLCLRRAWPVGSVRATDGALARSENTLEAIASGIMLGPFHLTDRGFSTVQLWKASQNVKTIVKRALVGMSDPNDNFYREAVARGLWKKLRVISHRSDGSRFDTWKEHGRKRSGNITVDMEKRPKGIECTDCHTKVGCVKLNTVVRGTYVATASMEGCPPYEPNDLAEYVARYNMVLKIPDVEGRIALLKGQYARTLLTANQLFSVLKVPNMGDAICKYPVKLWSSIGKYMIE